MPPLWRLWRQSASATESRRHTPNAIDAVLGPGRRGTDIGERARAEARGIAVSGDTTDYRSREIALLGRLHGVPTPVNTRLQRLAARAASEGLGPGSFTESDVLA